MRRHGAVRKLQQENALGRIIRFERKGINKKIANLSYAQMKTMRPQWAHFSESELRLKISEELSKK